MNWIEKVGAIIRKNLAWSPIPLAMKEQVVVEALEAFQNPPAPEEKKPEVEEPLTMRGEKLSDLRTRAHKSFGWENGVWE
jgi:hypothetical protein